MTTQVVCFVATLAAVQVLIAIEAFSIRPFRSRSDKLIDSLAGFELRFSKEEFSKEADADFVEHDLFSDRPETSQMTGFIADYLRKERQREIPEPVAPTTTEESCEYEQYSHLIAIPVDSCHELTLELESVQRAILYHCPLLVHACIAPSMMRMPLLYVTTGNDENLTKQHITEELYGMLQKAVQKLVYITGEEASKLKADEIEKSLSSLDEIRLEDGMVDMTTENSDGIMPLLLDFATLEIQGVGNQVLTTPIDTSKYSVGWATLMLVVKEIQMGAQEKGWKTQLADWNQSPTMGEESPFRPNIPFMRLPSNWEDFLRDEDAEVEDEPVFRTADEGGNGISPILWGQWMEDVFGSGVRMREIAIYQRRPNTPEAIHEQAFYVPGKSVTLPAGNDALSKQERRFQDYQEQRMLEAEMLQDKEKNEERLAYEEDPLLQKTTDRLVDLYQETSTNLAAPIIGESDSMDDSDNDDFDEIELSSETRATAEASESLDEWTRTRIQQAVASRARVQTEKALSTPKQKPPIEENPVFARYKEGTLVPRDTQPVLQKELPPFPSREHCVGFWRIVKSPTGFAVEENDSSRSDNLILRVDGTTAGGPILDQKSRQKASGGTWRLIGDARENAILRVRLVIPPYKERILVMEGPLEIISLSSEIPMATSTFGIPILEQRAAQAAAEMEGLTHCGGKVWIEDAITGGNRDDIGTFSMMKLNTPTDPKEFTITIPKPVRNQD